MHNKVNGIGNGHVISITMHTNAVKHSVPDQECFGAVLAVATRFLTNSRNGGVLTTDD